MPVPSYASGISAVALLGDTIGGNFDRTVRPSATATRSWTAPRAGDGPTANSPTT